MTRNETTNKAGLVGYEAFERAAKLLEEGGFDTAEELLKDLVLTGEVREESQALLGVTLFRTERFAEAIDCFGDMVSKRPDSESASVCLFHALWKAGREDEAFAEMDRYRAEYESMEYRRLVRDFKNEGIMPP